MDSWEGLHVPEPVLDRMREMGFTEPTTIQRLVLPAAIRDRKDILGAAETGSGKTLAYSIPIIKRILEIKAFEEERRADQSKAATHSGDESSMEEDEEEGEDDDFDQPPDEEDLLYTWKDNEIEPDLTLIVEEISDPRSAETKPKKKSPRCVETGGLFAVILTPTRELAVQVKKHIDDIAGGTGITVGTVIGGMSAQKQARILSKRPEIVVATPGRFWDFVQSGHEHLQDAAAVPLLVLDEADRLLESGHFAEVRSFLERVRVTPVKVGGKKQRQTFIFSATLTFIHAAPKRKLKSKATKTKQLSADDRVGFFMQALGLTERRPKIVDCTKKVGGLSEAYLMNSGSPAERDLHLVWLIHSYPGRTLVFCNSKNTSRRLVSVLRLIRCRNPLALHADMHQKARLKSLERFVADSNGLLIASDVAARGLDIPFVQHVLHYQPPKTSETYVHRSGRTARANRDGESVVLLGPEDLPPFRRLMWNMKRDVSELDRITPDADSLKDLRRVVDLARDIEATEHRQSRSRGQEDWFERAAREADLAWNSDSGASDDERVTRTKQEATKREKAAIQGMRRGLKQLLEEMEERKTEKSSVERLVTPRFPGQAVMIEQLLAEHQGAEEAEKTNEKKKKGRKQRNKERLRQTAKTIDKKTSETVNRRKTKRFMTRQGKLLKSENIEFL